MISAKGQETVAMLQRFMDVAKKDLTMDDDTLFMYLAHDANELLAGADTERRKLRSVIYLETMLIRR